MRGILKAPAGAFLPQRAAASSGAGAGQCRALFQPCRAFLRAGNLPVGSLGGCEMPRSGGSEVPGWFHAVSPRRVAAGCGEEPQAPPGKGEALTGARGIL